MRRFFHLEKLLFTFLFLIIITPINAEDLDKSKWINEVNSVSSENDIKWFEPIQNGYSNDRQQHEYTIGFALNGYLIAWDERNDVFYKSENTLKNNNELFHFLLGKSRSFIEREYPNYSVVPNNSEINKGYYLIDNMRCQDGGYIALLVGFDVPGRINEVGNVSLYIRGCNMYIPNESILEAAGLSLQVYGLYNQLKNLNNDDIFYSPSNQNFLSLDLPDNVKMSIVKKYDNKGIFFTTDCVQFN